MQVPKRIERYRTPWFLRREPWKECWKWRWISTEDADSRMKEQSTGVLHYLHDGFSDMWKYRRIYKKCRSDSQKMSKSNAVIARFLLRVMGSRSLKLRPLIQRKRSIWKYRIKYFIYVVFCFVSTLTYVCVSGDVKLVIKWRQITSFNDVAKMWLVVVLATSWQHNNLVSLTKFSINFRHFAAWVWKHWTS